MCVYTLIRCSENEFDICVYTKISNSFPVKAVPLSVLNVCGIPIRFMYCSKKLLAVLPVGVLQMHAAGHVLYQCIDTKMKNRLCSNFNSPMKSNWISLFGFRLVVNNYLCHRELTLNVLSCHFAGYTFLPFLLDFFIHLLPPKGFAACDILLIDGCPLWSRVITVFLKLLGTNRVDRFLVYCLFSSGICAVVFSFQAD